MLLEATDRPIKVRLRDGREIVLRPGEPVEIEEARARWLLAKAGAKVRVLAGDVLPPAPAAPLTVEPCPARVCYWEAGDGSVHRAQAVLLGMMGTGQTASWWVGIEHADGFTWVQEDRLRTKAQYEGQAPAGPRCASCDGPPPLTWRGGWLVCGRCLERV